MGHNYAGYDSKTSYLRCINMLFTIAILGITELIPHWAVSTKWSSWWIFWSIV